MNYIRLNGTQGMGGKAGTFPVYHSTFSPVFYAGNRTAMAAALADLAGKGFNIVRVFIDTGTGARTDGINGGHSINGDAHNYDHNYDHDDDRDGHSAARQEKKAAAPLSPDYLDNVADFIGLASARGLYVTPTLDALPANDYFGSLCRADPKRLAGYPNHFYLDANCTGAKATYVRLFLEGLRARNPQLLSSIAWLSLENEAAYSAAAAPFTASFVAPGGGRRVTTGDGHTYDMGSPTERQQAADSNAVAWANAAVAAARPFKVLVGVGIFTFRAVGHVDGPRGLPTGTPDPRFPFRPLWLSDPVASALDLLDVHVYQDPGWGGSMRVDLASSEWPQVVARKHLWHKPAVMGEFGAWRRNPDFWPNATAAAAGMAQQQVDACALNLTGSMFWTYDTAEQPRLWNFKSAPAIAEALAPANRPDACRL